LPHVGGECPNHPERRTIPGETADGIEQVLTARTRPSGGYAPQLRLPTDARAALRALRSRPRSTHRPDSHPPGWPRSRTTAGGARRAVLDWLRPAGSRGHPLPAFRRGRRRCARGHRVR
jgi:hypothetical protein